MARIQTITVKGTKQDVLQFLRGLPALLSGRQQSFPPAIRAAMVAVGLSGFGIVSAAFQVKANGMTDATGLRWQRLSPYTIKKKKQSAPANAYQILREFDYLRDSLSPLVKPGNATSAIPHRTYQVFRVRPGQVIIGTDRPHAAEHHKGNPAARLPQRRLWPPVISWAPRWMETLVVDLRGGVIRAIISLLRGQK